MFNCPRFNAVTSLIREFTQNGKTLKHCLLSLNEVVGSDTGSVVIMGEDNSLDYIHAHEDAAYALVKCLNDQKGDYGSYPLRELFSHEDFFNVAVVRDEQGVIYLDSMYYGRNSLNFDLQQMLNGLLLVDEGSVVKVRYNGRIVEEVS